MASKKAIAEAVTNMPELQGLTFPLTEEKLGEVIAAVRAKTDLPCPTRNDPPRLTLSSSPVSRHLAIQAYIEAYEYNFTGENFFNVKGVRQNQSLFRVHFNSEISGHRYGHIVLAVKYSGKLGAIGLSRRNELMFKAWGFDTLSDLILNYKQSYEKWSHKLNKIKLGTLIPHEGCSRVNDVVEWANTVISSKGVSWEDVDEQIHKKARQLGWEPKEVSKPPGAVAKARSKQADVVGTLPKKDSIYSKISAGTETEKDMDSNQAEVDAEADADEEKEGERDSRP
eukprot:CAMPEP_0179487234 /NCGR_PEP_ID=MMETSP0799-20121207/63286_1 /TAXON_ID=46947 /ORGANISM="Geminigera cryophila, Strain CCMP2564" /LENGTH=282 /DNA_ID=CAMNT_0021302285 /DNA_START=141 /DNA_END=986 /DNA_ORIENTATION=+